MPVEMPGVRKSTGEQEAPEEQHRESQVPQKVRITKTAEELDTCAHLQGSDPAAIVDPECWNGRNRFFGKHSQVGVTWMDGAHLGWARNQQSSGIRSTGRAGPGDIAETSIQEQHIPWDNRHT